MPVIVDNHSFMVSTTLFEALQSLRQDSFSRTIWVDALCINQRNLEELCAQVEMMPWIYSQACSVIAWLGPGNEDSRVAIENMSHSMPEVPRNKYTTGEIYILTRAFWSRIWNVQHITVASKIAVVCGSAVDWNVLIYALKSIEYDRTEMERHKIGQLLRTILKLGDTRNRRLRKSNKVNALMVRFRHLQASDPRDKVYALLGLADDVERDTLYPDYSKSTEEVFFRLCPVCHQKIPTAGHYFRSGGGLE
jgi:hypothetical protein